MRALAAVFALLAVFGGRLRGADADDPSPGGRELLDIEGNVVLVDEVYLAVLDIPEDSPPTPATAGVVERQFLAFLRRAGYALAHVDARVKGRRILVEIDEGRLAAIVVRGRDIVTSVAMQLQLDLPFDVFNRPQVERLLQPHRDGGATVSYTLVPVREVKHLGVQLDPLALLPGSEPQPPPGAYELHVKFISIGKRGGFKLLAHLDPNSILAGGDYSWVSGALDGDRWEIEAQVGADYFEDLEREADELKFSRVYADARWLTPSFAWDRLRLTARVREDLRRRQRQDLRLETYWWNRLEGALGVTVEPWADTEISLEAGMEQGDIFGIKQLDDVEGLPRVEGSSRLRGFLGVIGRITIDPDQLRIDRRHRLQFDARMMRGLDALTFVLDADYRKVFEFGWNDLWLRGAIGCAAGSYEFHDAFPMSGHYLRGVFGSQFYLDRAAAVGVEYRVSLKRDVFKVGVFHDAALFREATGGPIGTREVLGANSFGPSFHALVMDVLQLNLYYSFGFTLDRDFDHGVSVRLEKAF